MGMIVVVEECAGLKFIWPIWAVGVVRVRLRPRARLTRSTWVLGSTLGAFIEMGMVGVARGCWLEFIWPVWAVGVVGVQFVPRARLIRSTWVLGLTLGRIHSMGVFDAAYVGAFAFIPWAHLMRPTWVLLHSFHGRI